jgi:hypothetical protein
MDEKKVMRAKEGNYSPVFEKYSTKTAVAMTCPFRKSIGTVIIASIKYILNKSLVSNCFILSFLVGCSILDLEGLELTVCAACQRKKKNFPFHSFSPPSPYLVSQFFPLRRTLTPTLNVELSDFINYDFNWSGSNNPSLVPARALHKVRCCGTLPPRCRTSAGIT